MLPSASIQPHATSAVNLRRKIYELIVEEKEQGRGLPSQNDIRAIFGGLSEDVDLHLEQLAREGLLLLDREGGNGISLVPTYAQLPEVGLLGKIAHGFSARCGIRPRASIGLDLRGLGVSMQRGMYAVQVLDDRMSDAGIEYGDIALLVNTVPVTRGCIVAVEEADVLILRRYVIVSGIPHFLAENSDSPELYPAWNVEVQGVLWGLIRVDSLGRPARSTEAEARLGYLEGPIHSLAKEVASASVQARAPEPSKPRHSKAKRKNSGDPTKQVMAPKPIWPQPLSGNASNETRKPYSGPDQPARVLSRPESHAR